MAYAAPVTLLRWFASIGAPGSATTFREMAYMAQYGSKERILMPRKPNYRFERMERERSKAAKKAARAALKAERTEQKKAEGQGDVPPAEEADVSEIES